MLVVSAYLQVQILPSHFLFCCHKFIFKI